MSEREGALYSRDLSDGRELTVYPMTFGKARLCIGPQGDEGYDDAYCYEEPVRAVEVAATWDGEGDAPVGWHRHIKTGRRRPNGDPRLEYINK